MENDSIREAFERKKSRSRVLSIAGALTLLVFLFFVLSAVYGDWQTVRETSKAREALSQYYLEKKAFPVFAGSLTGQDPVNQELLKKKLLSRPIANSGGEKEFYYFSEGPYFIIEYCLTTGFLKGGKRGCGNRLTVTP